ncbi:Nif3-like dinuclear metal center hexameric protein [Flammeovirga sp. SubArs3]|uniref:Nif3-like dinuclear metal center hexameric protein n=1 Tax=Flammeovirga sp. SubArs3 TaxID=2995316 RepID=UPI00248BE3B0|nr:Nif3-like dinuclear metal center hexameric protein [Flammeovirga sp. SubArs3]
MKVKNIVNLLEQLAPSQYQENYDNAGLITGSGHDEVTGILVSLDCTEEIVDEAIKKDCNLIVAHHPIVFKGLKRFNGKNYVERTIIKAIKNDISIYAIHTNLDNMSHGVNYKISSLLGLENLNILSPTKNNIQKLSVFVPSENVDKVANALADAGAGIIGDYTSCSFRTLGTGTFKGNDSSNPTLGNKNTLEKIEEVKIEVQFNAHLKGKVLSAMHQSHPYEEVAYHIAPLDITNTSIGSGMYGTLPQPITVNDFLSKVKETFKCGAIRHTKVIKDTISKVAVCGGAGSFLLRNAIGVNADIFITGDFKYHEFFDAEDRIMIADIGHFESEQFTSDLLIDYLKDQIGNHKIYKTEINTNPIQYFT